jgi:hypothetical protein
MINNKIVQLIIGIIALGLYFTWACYYLIILRPAITQWLGNKLGITIVDAGEFDFENGGPGFTIKGKSPWYLKLLVAIFDVGHSIFALVGALGLVIGLMMLLTM